MTTRTITFSYKNQAGTNLQLDHIQLEGRKVYVPPAKDQGMTAVIQKYIDRLKERYDKERYELLMPSHEFPLIQFTVSLDLPRDGEQIVLKILNIAKASMISLPLKPETAALLDIESLKQLSSTPARVNITSRTNNATPSSKAVPPQSLHFIHTFFAWIGRLFRNLFRSEEALSQPTEKSPLLLYPTGAVRGKTVIAGILPLDNGNNICFINAIFQALMNAPQMKPVLIAGHLNKIERETDQIKALDVRIASAESKVNSIRSEIQDLTKDYSWYSYLFPDPLYVVLTDELRVASKNLSTLIKEQKAVQASRQASMTLNGALNAYPHQSIWLNNLRGFITNSVHSSEQEDASELLVKIFEPLIDLLNHPGNTNSALLESARGIIHNFGEEKQLVPHLLEGDAAVGRTLQLAEIPSDDLSELPPDGLRREPRLNSILPFAIPDKTTSLQEIVTSQLTMQKPLEPHNTSVYVKEGHRSDYQVSKTRNAIESIGKVPPEFVVLQLKRFKSDIYGRTSKIYTDIKLPEDNKLTLIVNGQNVNYEIQTLVLHTGSISGGHYLSYVKKDTGWHEANDSFVGERKSNLPSSIDSDVYMVFLKRIP